MFLFHGCMIMIGMFPSVMQSSFHQNLFKIFKTKCPITITINSYFPLPRTFFHASVFCKLLQTDPFGRISIMQFFNYVMRKVWLHQTRIGLSLYDVAGQGFLKEPVYAFLYYIFYQFVCVNCYIKISTLFNLIKGHEAGRM